MADDKNIGINIKTTADTSGADAAAQSLQKVGEAGKAAYSNNPMLVGKAEADEARKAAEEQAKAIEAQAAAMKKAAEASTELDAGLSEISKDLEDISEAGEDANEQGEKLDENVSKIARAQKAQALADLARQVGQISGKFREAASEVQEFDRDAADSMRDTADRIDQVTGAVSTLALGFATGGPVGLGVAALAIGVKELVDAFQASEVAAIKAAAVQREAMREADEATRKSKAALDERNTALASGQVVGSLAMELRELKGISDELQKQLSIAREKRRLENEVLAAEDQASLAEIDRKQAAGELSTAEAADERARIEGEARERRREEKKQEAIEDADIAAKDARIKIEAQQKAQAALDELERSREEKGAAAEELAGYAQGEIKKMVPNESGELSENDRKFAADIAAEIESARADLKIIDDAMQEAKKELEEAKQEASDAIDEVGEKTTGAADIISAQDRIGEADRRTQGSRRDTREIIDRRNREAEEQREQEKRERDDLDNQRGGLGRAGDNAAARIRGGRKTAGGLQQIADDIDKADNSAEIAAIGKKVQEAQAALGGNTVAALKQILAEMDAHAKQIAILEQRLRKK